MNKAELEKIKNHIGNIPSVGQMYLPELVSALELTIKERDSARAELEFIHDEYTKVSNESLTRDALELKLAAVELTVRSLRQKLAEASEAHEQDLCAIYKALGFSHEPPQSLESILLAIKKLL